MNLSLEFPQSLAEKYRPKKLADFVGVERPRMVMEAFVKRPFSSAWFLLGSSGLGKTSMAQAVALELGSEFHHIPSQSCDLESIERVSQMCHYIPESGSFHVALIDEADRMSNAAQLALLSKLDSTSACPNTVWFFTANTSLPLEPRFLSRCRVLVFEQDNLELELAKHLRRVYRAESGLSQPLSYFMSIAKDSDSNIRDALGKLEIEIMLASRKEHHGKTGKGRKRLLAA